MENCPSCDSQVLLGSLYCPDCGTRLVQPSRSPAPSVPAPASRYSAVSTTLPAASIPSQVVSLLLLDNRKELLLSGRPVFTLGRFTEDQNSRPDIDLGPYKAYEKGVSRLHASISMQGIKISVTDLGSSNGTRLNGVKISPKRAYHLQSGDVITLGELKLQLLVKI